MHSKQGVSVIAIVGYKKNMPNSLLKDSLNARLSLKEAKDEATIHTQRLIPLLFVPIRKV